MCDSNLNSDADSNSIQTQQSSQESSMFPNVPQEQLVSFSKSEESNPLGK